jgi:hypothetical protein
MVMAVIPVMAMAGMQHLQHLLHRQPVRASNLPQLYYCKPEKAHSRVRLFCFQRN